MQITILNKEYPLQWGMGAIENYCDMMECDIDGIAMIADRTDIIKNQRAIAVLILSAVKNGCDVYDEVFDVSLPKLRVAIDEMPQEKLQGILNDFENSKFFGKTMLEHLTGTVPATPAKKKTKTSASAKS